MTGSAKKAAGTYTSCEFLLVVEWLVGYFILGFSLGVLLSCSIVCVLGLSQIIPC